MVPCVTVLGLGRDRVAADRRAATGVALAQLDVGVLRNPLTAFTILTPPITTTLATLVPELSKS